MRPLLVGPLGGDGKLAGNGIGRDSSVDEDNDNEDDDEEEEADVEGSVGGVMSISMSLSPWLRDDGGGGVRCSASPRRGGGSDMLGGTSIGLMK